MGVFSYAQYLPIMMKKGDPYASYLAYDTFTRANDTLLDGATPEKTPEGVTWDALAAPDFVHDTGQVKFSAGGGESFAVDVLDLGVADVVLTAILTFGGGANGLGVCFNVQDANNLWLAWASPSANTVFLYHRVGGGFDPKASAFKSMNLGGSFLLSISIAGDGIAADFGGTPLNYSDPGGRPLKANTKHGLMMFATDDSGRLDTFTAAGV